MIFKIINKLGTKCVEIYFNDTSKGTRANLGTHLFPGGHDPAPLSFGLHSNFSLATPLKVVGSKPLYIGAYYRPHENDEHSLIELKLSLNLVRKKKDTIGLWLITF